MVPNKNLTRRLVTVYSTNMKIHSNGIVRFLECSVDLSTVRSISNPYPEFGQKYYTGKYRIDIGFNCLERVVVATILFYDNLCGKKDSDAYDILKAGADKAEQEYQTLITEWAKSIR